MFEISIVMRNKLGEPLLTADGRVRRRTFYADNGDMLYDMWVRNSVVPQKRKQAKEAKEAKGSKNAKDRQEAPQEQELGEDIQSAE